jgi:hypothetical protein
VDDVDVEAFWWHPGSLRAWVRGLIACAYVLTLAIAVIGARLLWGIAGKYTTVDPFCFRNLPAMMVGGVLAMALALPARTSRWIRIALVLPFAQIAVMLAAWLLWHAVDSEVASDLAPLVDALPLGTIVVGMGVVYVAVAVLVARRHERLHAVVMLALANLVVLGLWLPVATRVWCGESTRADFDLVDHDLGRLALVVLTPPLAAAIAFTGLWFRRIRMPRLSGAIVSLLFASALVASIARRPLSNYALVQFLHVLLAVALLAVAAIGLLAVAMALDAGRARRRLSRGVTGVICCDDGAAAVVSVTSWLRGPQQLLAPFSIATQHGNVPVPGGARWAGPLPRSTTLLRGDDVAVVLRAGDQVIASGFVQPELDDPFRSSCGWIPGGQEIVIGRVEDVRAPTELGLALWRPCVAYIAIVIAIGVPALVTALFAL